MISLIDDRTSNGMVGILNDGAENQRHFYHQNTLSHVYGLTDESANLVEAYMYDPYGRHYLIEDGNDGDSIVNFSSNDIVTDAKASAIGNPYMFTGRRFDEETGWHQVRMRYYSSLRGRFVSRDPDGSGFELGLYVYVSSSPTYWLDPLGLIRMGPRRKPGSEEESEMSAREWYNEATRGMTWAQKMRVQKQMKRGCVGLVCSILGVNVMPKLDECYETEALAIAAAKLKKCPALNCFSKPAKARVVGVYWPGLEWPEDKKGPQDFTEEEIEPDFNFGYYDPKTGNFYWALRNNPDQWKVEVRYGGYGFSIYCVVCEKPGK